MFCTDENRKIIARDVCEMGRDVVRTGLCVGKQLLLSDGSALWMYCAVRILHIVVDVTVVAAQ